MGRLTYDSTTAINFDDRTLAHLQIVIGSKLRRGESFAFSWVMNDSDGDRRNSLWMAPDIPLHFKYSGSRQPAINPAWIDELAALANSGGGLQLVPESAAGGDTSATATEAPRIPS